MLIAPLRLFFCCVSSVGSPLPPNESRSPVHVLWGRFAAALGDFTFRHTLLFTRQDLFVSNHNKHVIKYKCFSLGATLVKSLSQLKQLHRECNSKELSGIFSLLDDQEEHVLPRAKLQTNFHGKRLLANLSAHFLLFTGWAVCAGIWNNENLLFLPAAKTKTWKRSRRTSCHLRYDVVGSSCDCPQNADSHTGSSGQNHFSATFNGD